MGRQYPSYYPSQHPQQQPYPIPGVHNHEFELTLFTISNQFMFITSLSKNCDICIIAMCHFQVINENHLYYHQK